ncbi:MAG TPA: serine hydrolase domain-containing protein [Bacillota bacterium]|nr:serine hydrolase domain-containing protein [Bacillota bacterium]
MNGFHSERLQRAWDVLADAVAAGDIPGAVAVVGRRGFPDVGPVALGHAAIHPERRPMTPDTVFDLASLTKVVGTAMAFWTSLERGRLRVDDEVAAVLPAFAATGIRVRHLLTHTSGLPAWRDLTAAGSDPAERLLAALRQPPEQPPGRMVVYSDLGFITLGAVLSQVAGLSLPELARREVFAPLGMEETRWLPPEAWLPRIAATEWADDLGTWAWGRVHDENARGLGGIAGHAGLFSTAADLARLGRALLNGGAGVLSPRTVEVMGRNATANLNDDRTLGWQARGRGGNSAGDLMTEAAFGHTGFTGTCIWIDPDLGLFAVLLTNRVHLGRAPTTAAIQRLRPRFHNAVVAALEDVDV